MRVSLLALMALLGWSCASRQHAIASLALSCAAPSTAAPFDSSQVEQLAGVYALTLVADSFPSHGARTSGRLRLRVSTDTLRHTGERPLVGTLEMNLDAIFAPYSHDPKSVDPTAPGVYFDGSSGAFGIGVQPNLTDGTSTSLTPLLVWPEGFQGRWTPHYGIASIMNPSSGKPAHVGGDFCAIRMR
ncbi:MAG TPA: hypothetical protein VFP39_15395 [Gemmatimonadales bacterium]|nr:hypothetical protein [Gemmatimonadales bacterium]